MLFSHLSNQWQKNKSLYFCRRFDQTVLVFVRAMKHRMLCCLNSNVGGVYSPDCKRPGESLLGLHLLFCSWRWCWNCFTLLFKQHSILCFIALTKTNTVWSKRRQKYKDLFFCHWLDKCENSIKLWIASQELLSH